MSQAELAKKFGITPPSYSRWENGTEPGYEILVELAKYFKISIDDLLTKEITPADVPPRYGGRREEKTTVVEEPGEGYSSEEAKLIRVLTEKIDNMDSRLRSLEAKR